MDSVDKTILRALRQNCRVQYQTLANELGLSLNAVKNRVKNLAETGVIISFGIWLGMGVMDAGFAFILLKFDGSQDEEYLTTQIAANPMTQSFGFNSIGGGLVRVEYQGIGKLSQYGSFLRRLDGVESIEIHPIDIISGKSHEFTKQEVTVLRCLRVDPRMPVRTIANKTGIPSKKITRAIQQFLDERLIQFSIDWDLNAGGSTTFILQIEYDDKSTSSKDLDQYMDEKHHLEYWGSLKSGIQPMMLAFFMVEHVRDAEAIAKEVRTHTSVNELQMMIPYPEKKLPGLGGFMLDELLKNVES